MIFKRRSTKFCRRNQHVWKITRGLSHSDIGSKGELWRCQNCPKIRAL